MPDGRTHALATLAVGSAVTGGLACLSRPTPETLCVGIGFLISLAVNPDLDLNRRFPRRNPAKWPWWLFWYPYSRMVGHRSFFSHVPLVGTFIRTAYIIPLIAVCIYLGMDVRYAVPVFVGMAISDAVHSVLDVSVSSIKTLARK